MKKDSVWWKNYYATHRESRAAYQRERYRMKKEEENRTFTNAQLADTVEKLRAKSDPSTLNSVDEFVKAVNPPYHQPSFTPVGINSNIGEILKEDQEAQKQAKIEALRKLVEHVAKSPPDMYQAVPTGKPCQICKSRITTEVFYEDPDWSGNVWLCEKHRKEKGL